MLKDSGQDESWSGTLKCSNEHITIIIIINHLLVYLKVLSKHESPAEISTKQQNNDVKETTRMNE